MKQEVELIRGEYAAGTKYDTVYFDLAKKTVEAYCEDDCDNTEMIDVNYEDFIVETPFDVIDNLKEIGRASCRERV